MRKIKETRTKSFGVILILFFLLMICTSSVSRATSYESLWIRKLGNYRIQNLTVDNEDNGYFSFFNQEEYKDYFTKFSLENILVFNKSLEPETSYISYLIDKLGNYFFFNMNEEVIPSQTFSGKEFTISKYNNELVFDSAIQFNLSNYFENEFLGDVIHVDSDSTYFKIRSYQNNYTVFNTLLLAKFDRDGIFEWNKTIDITPTRSFFGFCKNTLGNIFVENEGLLYYLNGTSGEKIWQQSIETEDPYLLAYHNNVLFVSFESSGVLLIEIYDENGIFKWELRVSTEREDSYFDIQSININSLYLGIVLREFYYDSFREIITSIFHMRLVNETGDSIYEDMIRIKDSSETHIDIERFMYLYPTTEGDFYLQESRRDRINNIYENSISFCKVLSNKLPIYPFIIGFLVVCVITYFIIRRKLRKE